MKKLLLGLLSLISTAYALESNFWISGEYSQLSQKKDETESSNKGSSLGGTLYYQFQFKHFLLDTGLGVRDVHVESKFKSGPYYNGSFDSLNSYLYIAPHLKLTNSLSLFMDNKISIINPIQIGLNEQQNVYTGLGLSYQFQVIDNVKNRLSFSLQRGLDSDKESTMATVSLHFSFGNLPKEIKKKSKEHKVNIESSKSIVDSFKYGHSLLNKSHKELLNPIVNILKKSKYEKIVIIGHTDKIGSKEFNDKLSVKRANAVKEHFELSGIDSSKIIVKGLGKTELIDFTSTPEGNAKNRRVEIQIHFDSSLKENKELLKMTGGSY